MFSQTHNLPLIRISVLYFQPIGGRYVPRSYFGESEEIKAKDITGHYLLESLSHRESSQRQNEEA